MHITVQYLYKSKYQKVGVLPIQLVKSNVSKVGPSLERKPNLTFRALALRQRENTNLHTNIFIRFRFVSLLCLRSTLCLYLYSCMVLLSSDNEPSALAVMNRRVRKKTDLLIFSAMLQPIKFQRRFITARADGFLSLDKRTAASGNEIAVHPCNYARVVIHYWTQYLAAKQKVWNLKSTQGL